MNRLRPVPVSGGLAFRQVKPGSVHTCGVTTSNVAYCWGFNAFGNLGEGTTASRPPPGRVIGGLLFQVVNATGHHSCGVTTARSVLLGTQQLGPAWRRHDQRPADAKRGRRRDVNIGGHHVKVP